MFHDMNDVRDANRRYGHYFFEPATMRFFRSRAGDTLYGGRYFVTSEQFEDSGGRRADRRYTVRRVNENGSIDTVGDFQAFATPKQAQARIRELLKDAEPA